MEYIDEKILELRKKQKKEQYATLDTGIYINDEVVEFERTELLEGNISIMLPKNFITLPPSMVVLKYPAESRPQIIKSSLDTSVNLGISWIPQEMEAIHTKIAAKQMRDIIKKLNPANTFFEIQQEDREDSKISWFDYKSHAIDGQVYNLMFITVIGHKMLHGVFNCSFKDFDEWKRAAHSMILSIWDLTRQKPRQL